MDQKKGVVRGICISKKRGTAKYPVESARIVPGWGIEEDAHGGKWHRQISLLALEKIEAFREQGADVDFGAFGENLIIEGFDLRNVPVDSEIRIGDTVRLKVTQIGKECHSHCAIYRRMGDCIMPREGIFAEVLEGGNICVGDSVEVRMAQANRPYSTAVITLSDKAFAGADVLATSYTLKQAIQTTDNYDMILCGRQTTDGDTAQVSGAIAEWMQTPRLNWVTGIEVLDGDTIRVEYCMEHRTVTAKVILPCLISVERDGFPPRMPSLKLKISGRKKEIHHITMADLEDQDPEHYGLKGSATRVKKIYPPEQTSKQALLCMEKDEAAGYIADILKKFLEGDDQ